jgi:deoxyribose-phosphate aldolase
MRPEELAKTLDHTVLGDSVSEEDVVQAVEEARESHLAAVLTTPNHTPVVAEMLRGYDVKAAAAIGLADNGLQGQDKADAAVAAVADGAVELEVLMDTECMLRGDVLVARDDIVRVVRSVRGSGANAGRADVIVKVVLESHKLGEKMTRLACKIVADAGADFAQTCLGTDPAPAVREVELMRDALPEAVAVSAAGVFDTPEGVIEMIGAGAARVGTTNPHDLLRQLAEANAAAQ